MLFCHLFYSFFWYSFCVVFAVKRIRRKFPAQRFRTRKKLAGKHFLFSVGLNILLCYKYFGLMVSVNFIALALRGQGKGY